MTDHTETLLRATFASREHLADPDVARALARTATPQSRRWSAYAVAAAVAVAVVAVPVALVAGAQDHRQRHDEEPPRAISSPATPGPEQATYRAHRAVALAEAERVVQLVPLPDGAEHAPLGDWPDSGFGMAPSDPDLRQIVVWSVPEEADAVGAYLRDHTLEGMDAADAGSSSSGGGPLIPSIEYTVPSPDPDAMIDTTVMVQWFQDGDRTLVRADAFTAARTAREPESLVPDDVTSVDVRTDGRAVTLSVAQDTAEVARLTETVDALPGSIRPDQVVSCPARLDPPPETTVTFHGPGGDLRFHLVDWCLGQVSVQVDGVRLPDTLDPGDLTSTVAGVLADRP